MEDARVRRRENKALLAAGDDSLKGTKYLWLRTAQHPVADAQSRIVPLMDPNLKTARAWAMKESLRTWKNYTSRGWAERF